MRRLSLLALTLLLAACGEGSLFSAPITVTVNPALLTLTPGQAASVTVTATTGTSTVKTPTVSTPSIPDGLQANTTPTSITVAATPTATPGLYSLPVDVTAPGGAGHTVLSVQVEAASGTSTPAPGFTLAATPATVSLAPGGKTQVGVTITPDSGFTSSVTLTGVSGSTRDLTASINGQGVLVNASSSTVPGTYVLTITASGGGQTRSTTLTITVTAGTNGAST